jgi:hypothetical protein
MQQPLIRLTAAAALALSCVAAQAADIVYQTVGPDVNSPAFYSDAAGALTNAAATKAQPIASTVNGIEWWGFYSNPANEGSGAQDSFTLSFYAGTGTLPGALLGSFVLGSGNRVATGVNPYGYYHQYFYSASFADYDLTGGPYFVSIVDSNPTASDWAWQQVGSLGGVGGATRSTGTGNWSANAGANMAFRLTYTETVANPSPVPEPETYALMLAGLGLLAAVARRRKAAKR